jgi:glycine oxidase
VRPPAETVTKSTFDNSRPDVLVIGAGVIGLSIGWRACRRGLRTLVLDAGAPARGATHAAAGMLAPVSETSFGEEHQLALNLESARRYPAFVAELESETGRVTGYRPSGTLAVALDRDHAEFLQRLHEFQLSLDLEAEWLGARECRALEPGLSPRVVGGIRSSIDHQVSPRALASILIEAFEGAGGELWRDAPVSAVTVEAHRATGVTLESGERVAAGQVVVAAGWRSGELGGIPDDVLVPVRPVKGQIIRLRGDRDAPVAQRVIATPEVYIVPREDGRVIVGATVEERGADTTVTAGAVFELLRAAYEALPGISELELIEATAGLRPAAPDNAPIVGPSRLEGLVWATAHWRNGILLAPITADAVVETLMGGDLPEIFAPFSPARFAKHSAVTR